MLHGVRARLEGSLGEVDGLVQPPHQRRTDAKGEDGADVPRRVRQQRERGEDVVD